MARFLPISFAGAAASNLAARTDVQPSMATMYGTMPVRTSHARDIVLLTNHNSFIVTRNLLSNFLPAHQEIDCKLVLHCYSIVGMFKIHKAVYIFLFTLCF